LTLALILIAFGIVTYYILPLSLLENNIKIIILVFFFILVGLILGFVILISNLQVII